MSAPKRRADAGRMRTERHGCDMRGKSGYFVVKQKAVPEVLLKVVTMPPVAAQMMMKAVDFLLLVPYPSDLLYPYSGDTSTLQSTL